MYKIGDELISNQSAPPRRSGAQRRQTIILSLSCSLARHKRLPRLMDTVPRLRDLCDGKSHLPVGPETFLKAEKGNKSHLLGVRLAYEGKMEGFGMYSIF